ncbi:MAG: hypothetical protein ABL921_05905 [Pirellula sp.]
MMPTNFKLATRTQDAFIPEYSHEVDWIEMNGCWVPENLLAKRSDYYQTGEQNPPLKRYEIHFFVQFHWFSLNTPIDITRFDKNLCSDIKLCRELVDPIKSGATQIKDTKAEATWKKKGD